jgi:Domain of unknown function (DUF4329)
VLRNGGPSARSAAEKNDEETVMPSDSIYRLLTPRTARSLLLATAIGFVLTAAAVAEAPRGPGAVFASVEAAATDALQFAAVHKGDSRREWGGAISRVAGGFSYEAPTPGDADGVRLALGAEHVAWYYTHGPRDAETDRLNENLSRRDRQMVDRVDPQHRPLFVLTPSGRLIRYADRRLVALTPATSPAYRVAK